MERDEIIAQVLDTWRRHNEILIYLLDHVPPRGLGAVPAGSRGRDVAAQFVHLDSEPVRVMPNALRVGAARAIMPRMIEVLDSEAGLPGACSRFSDTLLALKQSGVRLPEAIAIQGLWGRWIFGT